MGYAKKQKTWNSVTGFMIWAASISGFVTLMLVLAGEAIPAFVTGVIMLLALGGMNLSNKQTKQNFDLANIQSLIQAPGIGEKKRARMARRIYRSR